MPLGLSEAVCHAFHQLTAAHQALHLILPYTMSTMAVFGKPLSKKYKYQFQAPTSKKSEKIKGTVNIPTFETDKVHIQQGLEIHGLKECGPWRYTVFNWFPKHLRYTDFGQKP